MTSINLRTVAAVAAILCAATPAAAADFSYTGNLSDPNAVALFNFSVGSPSTVTLRTYSYAGGTNSAGTVIARGGFDPILALFDASGTYINQNDDGGLNVSTDPLTGRNYDTFLQSLLAPGNYTVSVQAYSNFAIGPNLSDGFQNSGNFSGRTSAFAFDILGVNSATQVGAAVPEPATWAMMLVGFAGVGVSMRRRRRVTALAAA